MLKHLNLHSNMFLLILDESSALHQQHLYLHSNMFLLIRRPIIDTMQCVFIFTFQYVSINTPCPHHFVHKKRHLHSNMFLLIRVVSHRKVTVFPRFTFQYVSINTCSSISRSASASKFTFQYVSINTIFLKNSFSGNKYIYIPICFY